VNDLPGKTCQKFDVPGYYLGFQCTADDGADVLIDLFATAGAWTLWCGVKMWPGNADNRAKDRQKAAAACPAIRAAVEG
jgi:hypothetical protein